MRYIQYLIYYLLMSLCIACSNETLEPGQTGGFCLALNDDATVVTRMTPTELGKPLATQFHLQVINDNTGTVVYNDQYTDFVSADNGDYTLTATCGQDVELGLNTPYYYGEAQASITADDLTPAVTIPCHVANSLLSVRYIDKDGNVSASRFDEYFSHYHIRVELGGLSSELTNERHSAYFRAGTMPQVFFVGTLAENGHEIEYELPASSFPPTLEAAEHLIINLALEVKPAGVILKVVKAEVKVATVESTIPLDWLPAPKMSAYSGESSFMRYEDEDVPTHLNYTLTTAAEVQDVELTIDCGDSRLSALNGTHLLSQMTAEERQTLEDMGFDMPEIGSTYNATTFNLNAFAANLRTNDGAITHNNVGIRVKANDRWTSSSPQTFNIEVRRLRLTLPPQKEGNAWSHTLYIAPITAADIVAGEGVDVAEVLSSIYYEVSDDGGQTWTTITTTPEGDMLATTLNSGTTYQLRARYPATTLKSNAATQTMETPAAVPNGDFEELRQTLSVNQLRAGNQYKIKFIFTATYTNYATYTIQEPVGWASVNGKTCDMSASVKDTWYQNPSTYNTTLSWSQRNDFRKTTKDNPEPYANLNAQNGSNAMVLRNVGWDNNGSSITVPTYATPYYNTNVPSVSQRSAGKLFLGSYTWSGGNEQYNEGASFANRPTALAGYYKYAQDGDATEYGTVIVTLLNGNTVLGTGTQNLTTRSDYGRFDVPINYTDVSLHPTALRIMFTSSRYASYSQSEETSKVKVTTYNGEYESCMRGATLTIDNLTFTYDK